MVQYGLNNVPSYENFKGPVVKSHMGSQSHDGSVGAPVHDPGGYTAGAIGSGTPVTLEKGAPSGMEM
jgi:hypothetical protein